MSRNKAKSEVESVITQLFELHNNENKGITPGEIAEAVLFALEINKFICYGGGNHENNEGF